MDAIAPKDSFAATKLDDTFGRVEAIGPVATIGWPSPEPAKVTGCGRVAEIVASKCVFTSKSVDPTFGRVELNEPEAGVDDDLMMIVASTLSVSDWEQLIARPALDPDEEKSAVSAYWAFA